ncbi:restriction endonuclease subunit S [Streptomyces sp. NPDC049040]|uniref:restriction endonuclease subunit S n=1 Tax=Streptomyces sp. NPDC049040 TaxID=3365593 RepID=UPI003721F18E
MGANHAWVAPGQLIGDWLSAQAHLPQYLQARARVAGAARRVVPLGDLCSRITQGPNPKYTSNDYPCVITRNVANDQLQMSGSNWVSADEFSRLQRFKLQRGDILVTLKGAGSTGKACVFDTDVEAIHSREVGVVRVSDSTLNPRFLCVYFQGRFGRLLFDQGTTGSTGQLTLSTTYLKSLPVPLPDRRIQDYIGAKVLLAERCRSRSAKLRSRAMELLAQSWAWGNRGPAELQDKAASQIAHTVEPRIFEDRLDPEFYRPSFLAVDGWLDGQPCWSLSELVEAPVKGVQPSYDPDGSVPALTVTHVDPFVLDRNGASGLVTDAWLSRNARARIEAGELLYTVTGPPLGETVVVEEFHLPAAVNSHVARVALRPHFNFPHLVTGMLNSPLGQLQTTRYSKGIRQKELYPVDFARFRFPKLSSQTCTRLEKDFAASCRLVEEARVLTEQAKADVEALIEGTLDVQAILSGTVKAPTTDDIPELAEDDA